MDFLRRVASATRRALRRAARAGFLPLAERVLPRLGYQVRPRQRGRSKRDEEAARTLPDATFYAEWSTPCPMWIPWRGDRRFAELFAEIEPYTVVSPDRCHILWSLARHASRLGGHLAECGVYRGGTALLLSRVVAEGADRRLRLHLFDSFEGLPRPEHARDPTYEEGEFAAPLEDVTELLRPFEDRVEIRKGWIPATFAGLEDVPFSFVHVDVDLYQTAHACCEFFYPRLVPGGVLLFDEYGFPATRGEREAVDEYFADRPENPLPLISGQAFVTKLPE